MLKQVFTGLIYTEFYTPCQHFRNLVSSWEVGKTTCVKQVVNSVSVPKITLKKLFDTPRRSAVAKHRNSVPVAKITLKHLFSAPKTSADAKHQNGVFVAKITLK